MKIDTTKIVGYEEMSAEEKLQALEGYEFDTSGYVKKSVFDKTSSDLASLKKQYKDKLSEEEKARVDREEAFNSMQEELKALKEEKQLSDMTSQFLTLGYEEGLARATAKAFIEGDTKTVFANQKAHQDGLEKKIKADLLKGTPKPDKTSSDGDKMTYEKLKKMSSVERYEYSVANPEEYKAIYEGK